MLDLLGLDLLYLLGEVEVGEVVFGGGAQGGGYIGGVVGVGCRCWVGSLLGNGNFLWLLDLLVKRLLSGVRVDDAVGSCASPHYIDIIPGHAALIR